MPGIAIDKKRKTLRVDALDELGVKIEDISLQCTKCGDDFMLPAPWENGNFDEDWFVCPGGCNKPAPKQRGEYSDDPVEPLIVREATAHR